LSLSSVTYYGLAGGNLILVIFDISFSVLGMKVYDTKEKEVILEPSFKFAGNPNIIVAVKAFGMKATVQVS